GRGGAVGGADEERDGVREAHRAAFGVDVAGGDAVDAFGEAGVVVPHPADARVEPLDVGGGDQPEDQRGQVRVDVPDRAARTEPAGVAGRAGEVEALEEPGPDLGVEGLLEPPGDGVALHPGLPLSGYSCGQNK